MYNIPPKPRFPQLNRNHPMSKGLLFNIPIAEKAGTVVRDALSKVPGGGGSGSLNGASWSKDWYGTCLSFPGTLTVGWPAGTIFTVTAFTIIAVVNPSILTGGQSYSIVGAHISGGFYFRMVGQTLDLVKNLVTDLGASAAVLSTGIPQVVGVTYAPGGLVNFYLNGIKVGSLTSAQAFAATVPEVGGTYDGGGFGTQNLNGKMGFLGIWNRAFTPQEMKQNAMDPWQMYRKPRMLRLPTVYSQRNNIAFTQPLTEAITPSESLAMATTKNPADSIGLVEAFSRQMQTFITNSITLTENFLYNSAFARLLTDEVDWIEDFRKATNRNISDLVNPLDGGFARNFDGVDDKITLNNPGINIQEFSIAWWADTFTQDSNFADQWNDWWSIVGASGGHYVAEIVGLFDARTGAITTAILGGFSGAKSLGTVADIRNTGKHRFAFTASVTDNQCKLYQDGVVIAQDTWAPASEVINTLTIGTRTGDIGRAIAAVMDNFRVYSARLTQTEVVNDVIAANLEVEYLFDEPAGALAIDTSGHGRDGTFSGGPLKVAGLAPNPLFEKDVTKGLTGSITLADFLSKNLQTALSDGITFIEDLLKNMRTTLKDSIPTNESFDYGGHFFKNISDNVVLIETFDKLASFFREFDETITLTETFIKGMILKFNEALSYSYLLLEDGSYALLEDGSRILLDGAAVLLPDSLKKATGKTLVDTISIIERVINLLGRIYPKRDKTVLRSRDNRDTMR